jgi:hypothetical protein
MASVASALRTVITAANITNITTKVYRNVAPDSETYPFVTFDDDVSRTPTFFGDGVVKARVRTISVDLWQLLDAEDTTLIESLLAAIDGADLVGADKTIFGCTVQDIGRSVLPDDNICQHSLSVDVTHSN